MHTSAFALHVCIAMLACSQALAQSNVGELLGAGGKQLSADELKSVLIGNTLTGATSIGGSFEIGYKTNGSIAGTMSDPRRVDTVVDGAWVIDDNGKLCTDLRYELERTEKRCGFVFHHAAGEYFASTPDSNPSTAVMRRSIR
jgi:hypothetical protein